MLSKYAGIGRLSIMLDTALESTPLPHWAGLTVIGI